jgi:hypothetical protein
MDMKSNYYVRGNILKGESPITYIKGINMSASIEAKSNGLKSLEQVSKLSGVSVQTLNNWYHNKPALFHVVLMGCVYLNKRAD